MSRGGILQGFKDYYKAIKEHSGTGQLSLHGGDEMDCSFRFVRYAEGSMRLDCLVPPNDIRAIAPERKTPILAGTPGKFIGQTEDGLFVQIDDAFVIGRRLGMEAQQGVEGATGLAGEGYVRMEFGLALEVLGAVIGYEGNQSFRVLRYGITNLSFETSEYGPISSVNPSTPPIAHIPLQLAGIRMGLQPVLNYDEIIGSLNFTHGVDITCELILPVESLEILSEMEPAQCFEELDRKIDDMCTLLTLATGTRVNRYGLDFVDENGEVKVSFLHHAITARYKPHPFSEPVSPEHLKSFIEDTFPKISDADKQWNLRNVIDSYIDARESNLLTATGVKLAVCVEILKAAYIKCGESKTHLVPEKLFKRALKNHDLRDKLSVVLRETLGAALSASGKGDSPGINQPIFSDEDLDAVAYEMVKDAKPNELNRRIFDDVLNEMCEKVKLDTSDQERRKFVQIRNYLVHQGIFSTNHGDPHQQCQFLDDFVGRFLLATLGFVLSKSE